MRKGFSGEFFEKKLIPKHIEEVIRRKKDGEDITQPPLPERSKTNLELLLDFLIHLCRTLQLR